MKFLKTHRKASIAGLALVVAVVTGGAAYAYFSGGGSGNGSAKVGSVTALNITQVGAAYDSLITSNQYVQDQCLSCAGPLTAFGNEIHLATTGQLSDVVVAMRNWGDAIPAAPITLDIYSPSDLSTPIATDTQNFSIAVATVDVGDAWSPTSVPSVTNITFTFPTGLDSVTLPSTVAFGISYAPVGDLNNLNIALSSSATNLTVGTDAAPGYVWVNSGVDNPLSTSGDANACGGDTTLGTLSPEYIWCGFNPNNPGAYGSPGGQGADIPAVEFNVVGGNIPALFPGDPAQPVEYAITNTGAAQQVNSVTASVAYDPSNDYVESSAGNTGSDVPGCYVQWFQINNSPQALNYLLPENATTIFGTAMQLTTAGDVLSIQMLNPAVNQDACEGATLALVFSSN